jgi:hypothetical protein
MSITKKQTKNAGKDIGVRSGKEPLYTVGGSVN